MLTLAAASLGGHLLGTVTASGAALGATAIMIGGAKGKGELKFSQPRTTAIWGFTAGTLYSTAAEVWHVPGDIALSIAAAIQGKALGSFGMGAIAIVVTIGAIGAKKHGRAGAWGIVAATIYAAAGGVWGIAASTLAAILNQFIGA